MLSLPNELWEQIIYIFLNANNNKFYIYWFNKNKLYFYTFLS